MKKNNLNILKQALIQNNKPLKFILKKIIILIVLDTKCYVIISAAWQLVHKRKVKRMNYNNSTMNMLANFS